MSELFDELVKTFKNAPALREKDTTFCWDLNMEVLKHDSVHFKKVDVHYEADGLVCVYKCDIDDKLYTVKITPQKG
jgi:hypothetical protein